jgi:hypothetical protein
MNAAKIAHFIDNELSSDIQEVMMTKDISGKYYLFNKYIVVNVKSNYKVFCLRSSDRMEFTRLKNAVAWCILTNAGKYGDARRIEALDLKLSSIDVDIAVHKNRIKNSSSNFTTIVSITKLQEDNFKRRQIMYELAGHINRSKLIQDQNFRTKDSKIKRRR